VCDGGGVCGFAVRGGLLGRRALKLTPVPYWVVLRLAVSLRHGYRPPFKVRGSPVGRFS
jgi:hypothetical protein